MNTFTVNKKKYVAKEFDFGMMCDLEDMGYTLADIANKPTSMVRTYFAICAGIDKEQANAELQKLIIDGGDLGAIATAMEKEMLSSDFFTALTKKGQKTEVV